jgi:hypothetical protein
MGYLKGLLHNRFIDGGFGYSLVSTVKGKPVSLRDDEPRPLNLEGALARLNEEIDSLKQRLSELEIAVEEVKQCSSSTAYSPPPDQDEQK